MCQSNPKKRDAAAVAPKSRKKSKQAVPREQLAFEQTTDEGARVADRILGQPDLMNTVYSFFGPRELFNFALTSKENLATLTYDRVIGTTAMGDKAAAKTSLERVIKLVEKRQIWTPSPLRLLCLVNGKRCEKCNKTSSKFVSETFGVFYCAPCTRASLTDTWYRFTSHKRVARKEHHRRRRNRTTIWHCPVVKEVEGACGPLITHKQAAEVMDARGGLVSDEAFEKHLCGLDGQDSHAKDAEAIVSTFRSYKEAAQQQKDMRAQQQKETNANNNQTRKEKTLAMLEKLIGLVGDVPWRSVLATPEWVRHQNKTRVIAKFQSPLVEEQLHPLALAPSKATNKKLAEVAATLSESFGLIFSSRFHNGSFLSSSEPFESALLRCYQQAEEDVICVRCNPRTLDLVREGKLVEALRGLMPDQVCTAVVDEIAGPESSGAVKALAGQVWNEKLQQGSSPREAFEAAKARAVTYLQENKSA